jgi:hypothetical protein
MTPMAIINIVLVAGEVTLWEETGWSAALLLPIFIAVNGALAVGLIVAWVRTLAPKFQRFPDKPRFYSEIDVPSLPAPGPAAGMGR